MAVGGGNGSGGREWQWGAGMTVRDAGMTNEEVKESYKSHFHRLNRSERVTQWLKIKKRNMRGTELKQ